MPRVKRGNVRRAKRKKLLARAKGFYQTKSKLYRSAKESVDTALKYAFVGRRRKKRDFRRLWVMRINAAARENGLTYGQLIAGLKAAGNPIDRKSLADLAVTEPGGVCEAREGRRGRTARARRTHARQRQTVAAAAVTSRRSRSVPRRAAVRRASSARAATDRSRQSGRRSPRPVRARPRGRAPRAGAPRRPRSLSRPARAASSRRC